MRPISSIVSYFHLTNMRKECFESSAIGRNTQNELENSKESLLAVVLGKEGETLKQENHQFLKRCHE